MLVLQNHKAKLPVSTLAKTKWAKRHVEKSCLPACGISTNRQKEKRTTVWKKKILSKQINYANFEKRSTILLCSKLTGEWFMQVLKVKENFNLNKSMFVDSIKANNYNVGIVANKVNQSSRKYPGRDKNISVEKQKIQIRLDLVNVQWRILGAKVDVWVLF